MTPQPHWRYEDGTLGSFGGVLARLRFQGWMWACAIVSAIAIWGLGYAGYFAIEEDPADSAYKALQLFGLNYAEPVASNAVTPSDPNLLIQLARFLAPLVLVAAIIKLLADGFGLWLRRVVHTQLNGRPRDIVLGFGPVGRAVGERLLRKGYAVTWIAAIDGGDEVLRAARQDAEVLGGFLIVGDPSSAALFAKAHANEAARVFVALENDLACLDAAEALRLWLKSPRFSEFEALWGYHILPHTEPRPPHIRIFNDSPEMAGALPHAATHGFVSGRDVQSFCLRTEAVRRLVLRARWDRTALLLGQERVHLVIGGCGWQGEALLDETLLLCLRAKLAPPLITVLDRDPDAARARIARRSPALFDPELGVPEWLPPRFVACDLDTVDYAKLQLRPALENGPEVPVTAWALCTGDDDLNLRAALALQTAMQRRHLDGAPIYARVWSGHDGEAHELGEDSLTQTNVFGGLGDALDGTSALEVDPDTVAKELHEAYLRTEATTPSIRYPTVAHEDVTLPRAVAEWDKLSPSKKQSNRRAHRHAAFKLADLGFDWHAGLSGALPDFDPDQRKLFEVAEQALGEKEFASASGGQEACFLAAMQNEHDRWTIDRAIDGWQLGPRDESRLSHPDMRPFDRLEPDTRAYDGVLLRALLAQDFSMKPLPALTCTLLHLILHHGMPLQANMPFDQWKTATEILITLPTGCLDRPEKTTLDSSQPLLSWLLKETASLAQSKGFCRLILDFPAPPTPQILMFANRLAQLAWSEGRDVQAVWSWTGQSGFQARAVGSTLEYNADFLQHGLLRGPQNKAPVIGFVGHRELSNSDAVETALKDMLKPLVQTSDTPPTLLTGFALGADRMAVEVWKADKGKVSCLFPYPDPETREVVPATHAWTDVPAKDQTRRICFADAGIDPAAVTLMQPEPNGPSGHVLLADYLTDKADWLIAVWDEVQFDGTRPGGTAHIVDMMRAKGKRVVVIKAEKAT
jgi:TrkA-N domain